MIGFKTTFILSVIAATINFAVVIFALVGKVADRYIIILILSLIFIWLYSFIAGTHFGKEFKK